MFEFAQIIKIGDKVLFNAWRREIDIFIIILRGVILMDRIKLSRHIKKGDTLDFVVLKIVKIMKWTQVILQGRPYLEWFYSAN